jgi:hypothetical protein
MPPGKAFLHVRRGATSPDGRPSAQHPGKAKQEIEQTSQI